MSAARIIVKGNVGRDPEIKFSKDGKAWTKFSIAHSDRVRDGDEWVDGPTTWYDVICFGGLAESVGEGVRKGDRVVAAGRFSLDEWQGQDGNTRTTPVIRADDIGVEPRRPKVQQRSDSTDVPW